MPSGGKEFFVVVIFCLFLTSRKDDYCLVSRNGFVGCIKVKLFCRPVGSGGGAGRAQAPPNNFENNGATSQARLHSMFLGRGSARVKTMAQQ